MRLRSSLFRLGVVVGAVAVSLARAEPVTNRLALKEAIDRVVDQPAFEHATWGVKVLSLDTGLVLYERNPHTLLSPASNTKLYTVALALDRLGPAYRIETSLYSKALPNRHGTLQGDLIVVGRGDFGFRSLAPDNDPVKSLQPLVYALTNAGVHRIKGDLIGNTSFFRGSEYGSGWVWDDLQQDYGAKISALTINNNVTTLTVMPGTSEGFPGRLSLIPACSFLVVSNRTITLPLAAERHIRVDFPANGAKNLVLLTGQIPLGDGGFTVRIPVPDPAAQFISEFREALRQQNVKVGGKLRIVNWLDEQDHPEEWGRWVRLGSVSSATLQVLVREILKPSQNLYADLLLSHLGEMTRAADTSPLETSEHLGILELGRFLAEVGIPAVEAQFEEGSGLSRNNLTTANATVRLLEFMSRHPGGEVYRQALPIAGVDGTLGNRMKGTPAQGRVLAKTGTLRWAHSLSGYVNSVAGERLAFSILLNRYSGPGAAAREALDTIAAELANTGGRSSAGP